MATRGATEFTEELLDSIAGRVEQGLQVRRSLSPGGRVHIDRKLPFLIVYRPSVGSPDGTLRSLVASQASYAIAPSDKEKQAIFRRLVERIAMLQSQAFGGFLVIELWVKPGPDDVATVADDVRPDFEIAVPRLLVDTPAVDALTVGLSGVKILGQRSHVVVRPSVPLAPRGERRLVSAAFSKRTNTHLVGVAAYPAWRSSETGEVYPFVRRTMIQQASRALAKTAYVFAREETTSRPLHYQALGRRAVVRAVHLVDHELADVAESFDLLLSVTPVNADSAYRGFVRSRTTKPPRFQYRPIAVDPSSLKRRLFNTRIERVEDPTLEALFREKQRELELKLSLLSDRLTDRFLPTSVALYGKVDDASLTLARSVLDGLGTRSEGRGPRKISAEEFAAAAEAAMATYRAADGSITPRVDLRDDVSSLMVSAGNLLVGRGISIPSDRVEALIQHEIGTHVVTYWNGRAQPFRLLASGLAHHDELQEGLAVFAEYLVGGLTQARLRTLAARVVAAHAVSDGAEFIDTYRLLADQVGLGRRNAFMVAMRVHRGGGLVKDAVYLRGLQGVVDYIRQGGRLDTLLVGKIAPEHTAIIEELQRRGVLTSPPLRPSFLNSPDTHYRIERVRNGIDLPKMADPA